MFYLVLAFAVLITADTLLVATIIKMLRFRKGAQDKSWQNKPGAKRWVRIGNSAWTTAMLGSILFLPAGWPYGIVLAMATAIPLMAIMIFAGDGAFGEGEGAG